MRAVVDVNVLLSALLNREGSPGLILRAWISGDFEMVVSPRLLAELERAATYPKLSKKIGVGAVDILMGLIRGAAVMVDDPKKPPPVRSTDPGDDYLIALAAATAALLVSGDRHLLDLAGRIPVYSPSELLGLLVSPD